MSHKETTYIEQLEAEITALQEENKVLIQECDRLIKEKGELLKKTADVQPVKHGRWIPQGDDMWLCSNCKENIIFSMHESDRTEKQRYCCKCGARMDGDTK